MIKKTNKGQFFPFSPFCFFPLLSVLLLFLPRSSFAGLNSQFFRAVSRGDLSKVKSLIDQGADINAVDKAGDTALMEIASNGHADMPQLWNDSGFIRPDFLFPKFHVMPVRHLSSPISQKQMEVAHFLILNGADLNAKNIYGRTALMLAAKYGQAGLVELLLNHGADVDASDENGRTALDYAYQTEHQQVAALIEDYRRHPPSPGIREDAERLSNKQNLTREDVSKIALKAAQSAQNSTQADIARRLDVLAKEIESLKKQSKLAKKTKAIKSDVDAPSFEEPPRRDDFAIVVGVEKYAGKLPHSEFSQRDALTVKKYMLALGVPARHIRFLLNETATKSDLAAYLEDWLPKNVGTKSRVFFYFSGHGAPNPDTGQAYLVPFDGDPEFLEKTAYPLKRLYADFLKIHAKRIIVVLDSCFSGAGARSIIRLGIRPLSTRVRPGFVPGNGQIAVLTAARDDQTAEVIKSQGHGLLTYYFLRGLNGKALSGKKNVTLGSLYDYLEPEVENVAELDNHSQNPQLLPRSELSKILPIVLR